MKFIEERQKRKRFVWSMALLSIVLVLEIMAMVGLGMRGTYPQFGYVSVWLMVAATSLFTIFFIYLNELVFKRKNPIAWIIIISGMALTAQLLLAAVF